MNLLTIALPTLAGYRDDDDGDALSEVSHYTMTVRVLQVLYCLGWKRVPHAFAAALVLRSRALHTAFRVVKNSVGSVY